MTANSCGDSGGAACAPDADLLALQMKALGHPMRLAIIRCLDEKSACCCGELCSRLPLAQSTISQHLDLLCRAQLVKFASDGNRSRYTLSRATVAALSQAIGRLAQPRQPNAKAAT